MSKTSAAAAKASTSDPFGLFGLAPAFSIDLTRLDAAYREVQSRVHPDRFAHAGDAERRASMQMTTRVNEAYRILKSPVQRAKYLLERNGVDVAFETDTAMPVAFLARQMELRERIAEAETDVQLDAVRQELVGEMRRVERQIGACIDDTGDFPGARLLVRELMFLDRVAAEIAEAYEALDR